MNRLVGLALSLLFVLFVAAGLASQQAPPPRASANAPGPDPVLYTEARTTPSTFRDRGPSYAPTYLIYADKQRSAEEAKKLVDDLGMLPHLDGYKARAFVVGPVNGGAYIRRPTWPRFRICCGRGDRPT